MYRAAGTTPFGLHVEQLVVHDPIAVLVTGTARCLGRRHGWTVNAFLEFLPTVGLAMVVNLRRGYPDTVLAEKFLVALL